MRPLGIAAQQREIAAVRHHRRAGNDAVDALAQRGGLPFDRGNVSRFRIEQDRGDLTAGCVVGQTVERAQLKRQVLSLMLRELLATDRRTGPLSGEAAFETLDRVLARGEVAAARNDEAASSPRVATDKPELVTALRVAEQNMEAVVDGHTRENRREIVEPDEGCCGEGVWCRRDDNSRRQILRPPDRG